MRTLSGLHRAIVSVSGGRLGGDLLGLPSIALTTVGRRSGKPRVSMLTVPVQVGPALVVVASAGGDDRHPSWFLNLVDDPHVRVAVSGGQPRPMVARVATPEERDRLWPQVTAALANYAEYQERTARVIPLVLLEPDAPPPG
jgi:deazaflavin-dependent oxidoreductase (nitroreductase family)